MSDTFKILADFLEKYGDDVEGRSAAKAPDEVRRQLQDFAAGHLRPDERARISQLLKENPQWVGLLAEAVRTAGPRGSSPPSPN
jgi:hypothetical protein